MGAARRRLSSYAEPPALETPPPPTEKRLVVAGKMLHAFNCAGRWFPCSVLVRSNPAPARVEE